MITENIPLTTSAHCVLYHGCSVSIWRRLSHSQLLSTTRHCLPTLSVLGVARSAATEDREHQSYVDNTSDEYDNKHRGGRVTVYIYRRTMMSVSSNTTCDGVYIYRRTMMSVSSNTTCSIMTASRPSALTCDDSSLSVALSAADNCGPLSRQH